MAIAKTNLEKQQKTANLLSAGNLWYQRKSSIALERMGQTQTMMLEQQHVTSAKLANISANITKLGQIAEDQVRELKLQSARQEQRHLEEDSRRTSKENEDKEMSFRRDAFFHLSEELKELESSKISNLEKYFSIMSVSSLMDKYEISTSLTNDLSEKKIIQDTLSKIKDLEQSILKKFSKQDNSDLNAVFEIMEEDEELQINQLEKEKSKIDKILIEIDEVKKSKNLAQIVSQHKRTVKEIK